MLQGTQKAHASSKRLQGADTNGITITPLSCVMGTAGSGNSSECAYTIGAAESTPAGTYPVPVSATDSSRVVQNLGSITVLVSGAVTPSSRAINHVIFFEWHRWCHYWY